MCNILIGINLIAFNALTSFLFHALFFDVLLQIADLLRHCDDSLSEGEIIPFSGVSSLVAAIRCGWVKFSFRSFVRFSRFTMALK